MHAWINVEAGVGLAFARENSPLVVEQLLEHRDTKLSPQAFPVFVVEEAMPYSGERDEGKRGRPVRRKRHQQGGGGGHRLDS